MVHDKPHLNHNRNVLATKAYEMRQSSPFRPEYSGLLNCRTNIHPIEFPSNAYVTSSFYETSFPYISGGCELPDTSSIREFQKAGGFCTYTQPKLNNQGQSTNPSTGRFNLFSTQNRSTEDDMNSFRKNTRYEGNYSSYLYQPNHDQPYISSSYSTCTGIIQNSFERVNDSKTSCKDTISQYPSFSDLLQTPSWASTLPPLMLSRNPNDTSVETAQNITLAKGNPKRSERYQNKTTNQIDICHDNIMKYINTDRHQNEMFYYTGMN